MRKILFHDKFNLTRLVIEGKKTQKRIPLRMEHGIPFTISGLEVKTKYGDFKPKYRIGERLAVVQEATDAILDLCGMRETFSPEEYDTMYNCLALEINHRKTDIDASFFPHIIEITDIKLESLAGITDEDCKKEGVFRIYGNGDASYAVKERIIFRSYNMDKIRHTNVRKTSPQDAFMHMFNKAMDRGTYPTDTLVYVYEFKLVR